MTTPGSPSRHAPGKATTGRDRVLADLSLRWGLKIRPPQDGESPSKRRQKLAIANKAAAYAEESFFKINFLCLKDETALSVALDNFQCTAKTLLSGWVYKPNADEDLLPRSIGVSNPSVTGAHQEQLFECLLRFINPVYEQVKERQIREAPKLGKTEILGEFPVPVLTTQPVVEREQLDDTPIPFRFGPKGRGKRPSDGDEDLNDVSKRTRGHLDDSASRKIIDAVDTVPIVIRQAGSDPWPTTAAIPRPISISELITLPIPPTFKVPSNPRDISDDDGAQRRKGKQAQTANTSFTSNASAMSSVFDEGLSDASDESFFSTQTSVMEISSDRRWVPDRDPPLEMEYTQYGSGIDDFEVTNLINPSLENLIRERLQNVFPALPAILESTHLAVRYEITRVCSYAKVPMSELRFSNTDLPNLQEYDSLWSLLKNQPALKGKQFPQKSDRNAWTASLDKFHQGFDGVILSAKLQFNNSQQGPLFDFQLQPLKIEVSHRLGRRFGNDRFMEMRIPSIYAQRVPKLLKDAEQAGQGKACRKVIVEWMTREEHNFLGITWGAFYLKDSKKKPKLKHSGVDGEAYTGSSYCVYLFATDGVGFQASDALPLKGEPPQRHTKMTVAAMVNWLIPLEENKQRLSLKLFSRIALGLSKTWRTIELDPSEIRFAENLRSSDKAEVMNDGCGRLSLKMALNVARCLGLGYLPSGFQARIGGAKGFWVIDINDDSGEQWIEIYESQIKWEFSEATDQIKYEADHRTFEVVSWVKPLRSAVLNLQFLPILEDRGKTRKSMRDAISSLLVNGLTREIQLQRAAMVSPQSFRKWARDNMFGVEERIKYGQVPYKAGLPQSLEEKLNMLLDAGFDPQRLHFLKELAWKACISKCEMLKRKLNITVGRSTYAFMAVDFTNTLEPDEVHLGFSANFTDDSSGFSDTMLDGIDILVARSPAHFISDIQKVKAVWKRELKALKDVIVFSAKGNFPLAKKLSGGDYDGDRAWICFEPTIVDEFVNAEMPEFNDLVELGYIETDQTSYADICLENNDPVPAFLQHSFEFNLQDSLLGICTNFKEAFCYTINSVNDHRAVFLCTLLSTLVDQRKQGYNFSSKSWERVKGEVVKTKVLEPNYKSDEPDKRRSEHIIDYLKFTVAERTIKKTLEDFHKSLKAAAYWDDDLVKLAKWAKECAKESSEWKSLLGTLENEIKDIKRLWTKNFSRQKDPELMSSFTPTLIDLYEKWQAIAPAVNNPLSQALAPSCLPDPLGELSTWALLKASLGFSFGTHKYVSKFIWWMAGKQLAALKVIFHSGNGGSMAVVTPQMYAMLKPDATFVKLMQSQDHDPRFWEAKAESVVPDEEGEESDEESWA